MGRTSYYHPVKRVEKLSRQELIGLMFDLINAFRFVKNPLETSLLIKDLLTAREIHDISKRLRIAKMLLRGATQRGVASELHCSLATVSKIGLWLSQGGDGLRQVIARLPKKYEFPEGLPPGPIEFHLPELIGSIYSLARAKSQQDYLDKFFKEVEEKKMSDKVFKEAIAGEFRK